MNPNLLKKPVNSPVNNKNRFRIGVVPIMGIFFIFCIARLFTFFANTFGERDAYVYTGETHYYHEFKSCKSYASGKMKTVTIDEAEGNMKLKLCPFCKKEMQNLDELDNDYQEPVGY